MQIRERESEEPSLLGDLSMLNIWKQQVLRSLDIGREGNLEVGMEQSTMDWQKCLIERLRHFHVFGILNQEASKKPQENKWHGR